MGNLKEIRTRIASVRSTRKITSAMRVVAAAKYHKASDEYDRFKGFSARYSGILDLTLTECANRQFNIAHPLLRVVNPSAPSLVLMLASNGSLCGAFNANVAHFLERIITSHGLPTGDDAKTKALAQGIGEAVVWAFGKKGAEILVKQGGITPGKSDSELVDHLSFDALGSIFDAIVAQFTEGKYSSVQVVYNQFVNAAVQRPMMNRLLPLVAPGAVDVKLEREYIIEPSVEALLARLLPYTAKLRLYDMFLQNHVGEHGARMTSMAQATDNADALLDELTLDYNKARQSAITNELVEIVSGADALK